MALDSTEVDAWEIFYDQCRKSMEKYKDWDREDFANEFDRREHEGNI